MIQFIVALVLLLLALSFLSVHRTYKLHTLTELKRRARAHEPVAQELYKAAAYGPSLDLLIWLIVIVSLTGSFLLLTVVAPPFLVFLFEAAAIGYAFVWSPATQVSNVAVRYAVTVNPALVWVLTHTRPVTDRVARLARRFRKPHVHTKLYEHDDLLTLFARQKSQSDSRIPHATLDLLAHMLTFGTKTVRESMVPRRKVKLVSAEEPIGPVLMKELHESGFRRFPVYEGEKDALTGVLDLSVITDLKHSGTVRDVMEPHVNFVHEDHPLEQVIDAFYKTGAHLYIVTNEKEQLAGIITIEDILAQLMGAKIIGEFDQYDSRSAVAAYKVVDPNKADLEVEATASAGTKNKNPYDAGTLKHVIYEAGFRGKALETAYAVAMAESGGDAKAHNDDESTGDDSYGLFQINMLGEMGPERRKLYKLSSDEELFKPLTNARVAYLISDHGKNWRPWTGFTAGSYKKYLDTDANTPIKT